MTIKCTIGADGGARIEIETGQDERGETTRSTWDMHGSQVAPHMPMFENQLSRGDVDALRDVAREAERKRERGER